MVYNFKKTLGRFLATCFCYSKKLAYNASPSCSCCSRATCLTMSWSVWQNLSANATAEPLQSCTNVATAELNKLEFRLDIGVRVSPLQAAPDLFKFRFSLVTSVLGHFRVGALPIVPSESRYMTSVQHIESVVVRNRDYSSSNYQFKFFFCIWMCTISAEVVFVLSRRATLDTQHNGWKPAGFI